LKKCSRFTRMLVYQYLVQEVWVSRHQLYTMLASIRCDILLVESCFIWFMWAAKAELITRIK
jgi:hypothetical protein